MNAAWVWEEHRGNSTSVCSAAVNLDKGENSCWYGLIELKALLKEGLHVNDPDLASSVFDAGV